MPIFLYILTIIWIGFSWQAEAQDVPAPPLFDGGTGGAQLHFVSPGGGGVACTQAQPCTLDQGIAQATAGESVILLDGVYPQDIDTVRSGTPGNHIIIRAQNTRQATIRVAAGNTVEIRHNYITIRGLFVNDLESSVKGQGTIRINANGGIHHVIIEDNTMFHAGNVCLVMSGNNAQDHHIIVRRNVCDGTAYNTDPGVLPPGEGFYIGVANAAPPGVADIMIQGNEIRDFTSNAIDLKQSSNRVWVWDNVIHTGVPFQNHGLAADVRDGLMIMQGTAGYVYNNVIRDSNAQSQALKIMNGAGTANEFFNNRIYNITAQVALFRSDNDFGRATAPQIYNNTMWNNDAYTLNAQDGTNPQVRNNLGVNGVANNQASGTYTAAYFVNAAGGNFHLTANATGAINAVTGAPFSQLDADLNPAEGARDYGAYEFVTEPDEPPPPGGLIVFGPDREPCHTLGTDPGAIVLDALDPWNATINAGAGGQVYLLDSSQGEFNTGLQQIWKNVKVYPENCEDVVLDLGLQLVLGDNAVVAGLTMDFADSAGCVRMEDDLVAGDAQITNPVLRNNRIYGGTGGNCVAVQSNVVGALIEGNEINGGGTNGLTLGVRGDGRFVNCDGAEPVDTVIRFNKLMKDETLIPGWTTANWTNTEDLYSGVAESGVIFEGNYLGRVPVGQEEQIDEKYNCNGAVSQFIRNYFEGATHLADTKACMLVQTETTAVGTNTHLVMLGNLFDKCDTNVTNKEALVIGAKDVDVFLGGAWYNIFSQAADVSRTVGMRDTQASFDFRRNTIVNGGISFDGGGNPAQGDEFSEFEDNILLSGAWTGATGAIIINCSHNSSVTSTGALPAECTDTSTVDPVLTDTSVCTEAAECDFTPTSTAFLAVAGSDGAVRGAVVPPVINSAVVEATSPTRIEISVTLHSATGIGTPALTWQAAPMSFIGINQINCNGTAQSVCVNGAARGISSSAVISNSQIDLVLSSPIVEGDTVEFDASYGWCEDSANFGNIDLNGHCLAQTNFPVTNNILEGGGDPGDITSGLIAHWQFENDLLDAQGNQNLTYSGVTPTFEVGRIGQAIVFNGTDYASAGVHAITGVELFPTAGNPFSTSTWHKTVASGTIIASGVNNGNDRDFQIAQSFGGNLDLFLRGAVTSPAGAYNNGEWHHIVFTWSGTIAKLYVDNVLVNANLTIGASPDDVAEPILIGARTGGAGFLMTGSIDDVRIYNRELLAGEVATLFNLAQDPEAPSDVTDLQVVVASPTSLEASWSASIDPQGDPIIYTVEACEGAACSNFIEVDSTDQLSLLISGLITGALYRVRVRACDDQMHCSAYAGPVEATPELVGGVMYLGPGRITGGTFTTR